MSSQSSPLKPTKARSAPRASNMDGADVPRSNTDEGDKERRKKKFRFKKKHRHSHHDEEKDRHDRHRTSKRRKHDHHAALQDDPTAYDDTYIPNAASWKYAADPDPDAAFRESLFDAMADDEGAAFWEGVYGQPAHIYARPEVADSRGHLEQMSDEDYARYVREKMWEKSNEHIVEERKRREERRERDKRKAEEERHQWQESEKERKRKEGSRRERYKREGLRKRWREYSDAWDSMVQDGNREDVAIPWPVDSGKLHDMSKLAVEEFVLAAPMEDGRSIQDVLKAERVRWHPDKAQQRWGKRGLDAEEVQAITAVFQTIDTLYRTRASAA